MDTDRSLAGKEAKVTSLPEEKSENGTSLPEEQAEISEVESVLMMLDASFTEVAEIKDAVKREYALMKEAKRLDIPAESYRRMFETYYLEKNSLQIPKYPWLNPFRFLDQRLGDFVKWCENVSLYSLATVIGQFTLLAAMGAYFMEAPQRQQQALTEARQEIRNQKGIEYSQSRIEAIEMLNKFCESLLGEQATNANLEGIKLNNCYHFQLGLATFAQWPPQFYRYEGFDLSQMNLAGANLKGANLEGANLEGANLEDANLERANLKGANLKNVNLKGAVLQFANLEGANLEKANLDGTRMGRGYLKDTNLKEASLIGAWLLWADLQGADLSQANLQDSNLSRANFQKANLYKANLKGASLRYADLRKGTITIGTEIDRANIKRAKFSSVDQVKRAYNWEKAIKDKDWEEKIAKPSKDKYKLGYLIPDNSSTYKLYQQGIENAVKENQNIEFFPIATGDKVEEEAQGIKELRALDVDVILLRPVDSEKSVPAIVEAYASGVVIVTIGDCLPEAAQKVVFACYESDSFQMGYDVGKYMSIWAKTNLPGQPLNIGLVDGADSSRVYPYFQGFLAGIPDPEVAWNQVASTNAQSLKEIDKVKEMLESHPNINALWGGSEVTTTLALQAVKELGLEKKVQVFGTVPLTRQLANMLLDPNQALQSIIDESPTDAGYKTTKHGIDVIEGKTSREYQRLVYPHRLLTQRDSVQVNKLVSSTLDIEKNDLKQPAPLKIEAGLPSEIPSSLSSAIAVPVPAITDKKVIEKLQDQFQKILAKNWQSSSTKDGQTSNPIKDDLVYRVLLNKEGKVASYEPTNKLAIDFAQRTPLPKLLVSASKDKDTEIVDPTKVINSPVAEFKVKLTANGKVKVLWGESFLDD
ncbi:MAG TPA: pentapeptide repeat-containing protein [Kamptonema sp.]|nr:pentapeptide repeat-containing protein [Kamptonema sp.]